MADHPQAARLAAEVLDLSAVIRKYVPDGFRDDDGIWHQGPHRLTALTNLAAVAAALTQAPSPDGAHPEVDEPWQYTEEAALRHPGVELARLRVECDAANARADEAEKLLAAGVEWSREGIAAVVSDREELQARIATLEQALTYIAGIKPDFIRFVAANHTRLWNAVNAARAVLVGGHPDEGKETAEQYRIEARRSYLFASLHERLAGTPGVHELAELQALFLNI